MNRHAVLFYPDRPSPNSSLMVSESRKVRSIELADPVYTLMGAYDAARRHDVTHLWIAPNYGDVFIPESMDGWKFHVTYAGDKPTYARIWKDDTFGMVRIHWPAHGAWNWKIETPVDILATISYVEQVLGIPVELSPGHMGTELVKDLNRSLRRADWVRDATVNLFDLPIKKAGKDLIWKGSLPENATGMYLHQFDKKSAYLAACADLFVGAGDPVHVVDGSINTMLPGVYRVEVVSTARSPFNTDFMPPVLSSEWVTTDLLNYAMRTGYDINVLEAHQWSEKHKTLANYAEKLFTARASLKDTSKFPHKTGRENAETTAKEIALVGTGKFASQKSGAFKQPYWWAGVVDKARVIMLANIYKIWTETQETPVLIYSDSLYYLSTSPDAEKSIAPIWECGQKSGLGKYRHEGTWKVTRELIELFNNPANKAGKIVTHLNELWENEHDA